MAKKLKIPKSIGGFKVPKQIRKSAVVKAILRHPRSHEVLSAALIAAASAAAAALAPGARTASTTSSDTVRDAARGLVNVFAEVVGTVVKEPSSQKHRTERRDDDLSGRAH